MTPKLFDVLITREPSKTFLADIPGWILKYAIYKYQKGLFPNPSNKSSWWSTHSRLNVGGNNWLSVTSPKAKIEEIDLNSFPHPFAIGRYKYIDFFNAQATQTTLATAEGLVGTSYDYLQLIGIALHGLFPNLVSEHSDLVSCNKKQLVCSVGVEYCLLAGWKKTDRLWERPLGDPEKPGGNGIYMEVVPPAAFVMHPTFDMIYSHKW